MKKEIDFDTLEKHTVAVGIQVGGYRKKRGVPGVLIPSRASHVVTYMTEPRWTKLGDWSNSAIVEPPVGTPKPTPGSMVSVQVELLTDDAVRKFVRNSYGFGEYNPNCFEQMGGVPGVFRTAPETTPEKHVALYYLEGTDFSRTITVDMNADKV